MDDILSEYPSSWYPVSLSKELKPLKHIVVNMFGGDWIIFRTRSGNVGATSRFCCHIGTDLANGKVVDECIECPMHGWKFNTQGQCKHIPAQNHIPQNIKLVSLICEEHLGIIFVFYGDTQLFNFSDIVGPTDKLKYCNSAEIDLQAPYYIATLNTFDTQHYKKIHSREFIAPPSVSTPNKYCLKIEYTAKIIKHRWVDYAMDKLTNSETTVTIEAWGGSILILRNKNTHISSLVCAKPVDDSNSILYITAFKDKKDNQSLFSKGIDTLILRLATLFFESYLSPDLDVIANMKPDNGTLLDHVDQPLKSFFDYWSAFPKTNGVKLI